MAFELHAELSNHARWRWRSDAACCGERPLTSTPVPESLPIQIRTRSCSRPVSNSAQCWICSQPPEAAFRPCSPEPTRHPLDRVPIGSCPGTALETRLNQVRSRRWLRDGLGLIETAADIEELASGVDDCGEVCFVPALTGLGAPHWRSEARGILVGLSRDSNRGHVARAVLEGVALQIHDILRAMEQDAPRQLGELRVDGGASKNI